MHPSDIAPSPRPEIAHLCLAEIISALKAGVWDFRRAPFFGLFFSGFYVVAGILLVTLGAGTVAWTLVLSLGFPLIAPFAAVGLYEVSRRIEAEEPLNWSQVLSLVVGQKDRQLPWMGAILVIVLLFWSFLAHMIFALFMGLTAMTNISSSLSIFLTGQGLTMLAVEVALGAAVAFFVFAITVVGMPLLVDKEVDFVTAMLISIAAVRASPMTMLLWAAVIAGVLILAMIPMFLGLLVALPVLGHATWHIYRRVLYHPLADGAGSARGMPQ